MLMRYVLEILDRRVLRFLNNITGTLCMIPKIHMSHTTDFKDYWSWKRNGIGIYNSIIVVDCYDDCLTSV